MPDLSQQLSALLEAYYGQDDIIVDETQPTLRLNLHPNSLELWKAEYDQAQAANDNLLLACDNSGGSIESATLTWVVGSAIRRAQVSSHTECELLFQSLGLRPEMAAAITRNCPGMAMGAVWAIYYERHGNVVASPVLSTAMLGELMKMISSTSV